MSDLSYDEQFGVLTWRRPEVFISADHWVPAEDVQTSGWFSLPVNGNNVVMRKFRGRNRFQFVALNQVIRFVQEKGK